MPTSAADGPRRRSWRAGALAAGAYGALSWALEYPIWPGDPHALPTAFGLDVVQTTWFLAWTPHALAHGLDPLVTTAINAPLGVNLAENTTMPLLGLLAAPLTVLVSPVASLNLLRFFAFTLSALAAYAVLRRWSSDSVGAFAGGLLYGFSPYMLAQGSLHLDLIFVPLPPLIFEAANELFVRQQRASSRSGLTLGALCAAQLLISAEVLATTLVTALIAGIALAAARRHEVAQRLRRAGAGIAAAAGLLAAVAAFPLGVMLAGPYRYSGPAQGSVNVFHADLLGLVLPTATEALAPTHLAAIASGFVGSNLAENDTYLGAPLLAVLVWLVVAYRRRGWPLLYAFVAGATFLLSLGPRLHVDGHPVGPTILPFALLGRIPLLASALPVRFALDVAFYAAAILASGVAAWRGEQPARRAPRRLPGPYRRAGRCAVPPLVAAAVLATMLPAEPYRSFRVVLHPAEAPRGLAAIPPGTTVLTYPYPTPYDDAPMLWQALDRFRFEMLGGYALIPTRDGSASEFPSPLRPEVVEALLADSPLTIPEPGLPKVVATTRGILATRIVVLATGRGPGSGREPALVGRVSLIDRRHDSLYVLVGRRDVDLVRVSRAPSLDSTAARSELARLEVGDRVAVYGKMVAGTIGPADSAALRRFVSRNGVGAVLVSLGAVDSQAIAAWVRAALGPPTRAGGGGLLWLLAGAGRHGAPAAGRLHRRVSLAR